MSETVHILATCHNPALLPATTLVFETLRTGFPAADVIVHSNDLPHDAKRSVERCAKLVSAEFVEQGEQRHDVWVDWLITRNQEPFWICDTDMVFWRSCEGWFGWNTVMAGRYEAPFVEPWSGTHKAARLHTSLLWLNAPLIRHELRNWLQKWHPKDFPFRPQTEFVKQHYVPHGTNQPPLFYDTCAGLYQAIGGTSFTDEQNACFDHLHCGTYSDKIAKALPGLPDMHRSVFANRETARGLYAEQLAYYQEHGVTR